MFATDRDLLILEPNLFRDVGWIGQRLIRGIGNISDGNIVLTNQDSTFEAAGVERGHVVLVGTPGEAVCYEVLERLSPTEVAASRLRAGLDLPAIPPPATGSTTIEVWTFQPQIAQAHAQAMRMIGIEPGDQGASPGAADITNVDAVREVETLGALYLVFAAAAGPEPGAYSSAARAEMYRQRYAAARQRTEVQIDLDGDGKPDATRRFNMVQFVR
jgi:hypothetical protein